MEANIVDNKKKISVVDFIKKYETASTFVEKDNLVCDLIDTKYVPFVCGQFHINLLVMTNTCLSPGNVVANM